MAFIPIHKGLLNEFNGQGDGSNAFTLSRYLVPWLCDFEGHAIFLDGDMVMTTDIARLWALRTSRLAVQVVKHDYKTRHPRKYIGTALESQNIDYPRKNQSSVVLWNCGHPANNGLTTDYVMSAGSKHLHRFEWLKDEDIGDLPHGWNHLISEDAAGPASNYHFTLGIPGIPHYADTYASWRWHGALLRSLECLGQSSVDVVKRAQERCMPVF